MNTRARSLLVTINRVCVLILSLTGLLMDGIQPADLPSGIAIPVWPWLPLWARIEDGLLGAMARATAGRGPGTGPIRIGPLGH